jgi:hypothetical protein
MLQLRAKKCELTYTAVLMPYFAAVIDTPGRVASALAAELGRFDVGLGDIDFNDHKSLYDRGLTCEADITGCKHQGARGSVRDQLLVG